MLPRVKKIHLNKDFERVFKTGRSVYGRFLGVKIIKNDLDYSRFGLILGLKIDKSAVNRHQLKRLVFTAIESKAKKLPFFADCVIIALPLIKTAKLAEVEVDVENIFSKIRKK